MLGVAEEEGGRDRRNKLFVSASCVCTKEEITSRNGLLVCLRIRAPPPLGVLGRDIKRGERTLESWTGCVSVSVCY